MNPNFLPNFKNEGEVIATWGGAKLIKFLDGAERYRPFSSLQKVTITGFIRTRQMSILSQSWRLGTITLR